MTLYTFYTQHGAQDVYVCSTHEKEMPAVDGESVRTWPCDNDITCEFCEGAGYLDAVTNGEDDWA